MKEKGLRQLKALGKFWRSLYGKLVLIVALACIPAVILSVWMNYVSYRNNRQRLTESIELSCRNKFEIIEDRMKMLRNSLGDLVNNPQLLSLSLQTGFFPEVSDDIKALENSLKTLISGNRFAEEVEVLIPTLDRAVSYRYGTYELDPKRYEAARQLYAGTENPQGIHNLHGKPCIVVVAPFYNPDDSSQIVILAELSLDEIQNRLDVPQVEYVFHDRLLLGEYEMSSAGSALSSPVLRTQIYHSGELNMQYEYAADIRGVGLNVWSYLLAAAVTLLLILVTMAVSALLLNRIIARPIRRLVSAFGQMETGDLDFVVDPERSTTEYEYLFASFSRTLRHMNRLVNDAYEDGLRLKTAEYKQLAHQIHPHFLYNCLHIINGMARENDLSGIRHMTGHLTVYFKSLAGVTRETATLREEYSLIISYTQIQTVRFGDRIRAVIHPLPKEMEKIEVPHLSIQPLIENVYTHGLKNRQENGVLQVSISTEEGAFRIHVEDNGEELTAEKLEALQETLLHPVPHDHMALVNVHRRLQLMAGEEFGLRLGRSRLGGLEVLLRFPIPGEEDAERVCDSGGG